MRYAFCLLEHTKVYIVQQEQYIRIANIALYFYKIFKLYSTVIKKKTHDSYILFINC